MPMMQEPVRQAAHVMLDMVSAFDDDLGEDPLNPNAMNLAFQRMNEVEAVTATRDDETGELHLDASPLIGANAVAINWLVLMCAQLSDGRLTKPDVIANLREFIDSDD